MSHIGTSEDSSFDLSDVEPACPQAPRHKYQYVYVRPLSSCNQTSEDSQDDPMWDATDLSHNLQAGARRKVQVKSVPKIKVPIMKFLNELAQES